MDLGQAGPGLNVYPDRPTLGVILFIIIAGSLLDRPVR